MVLNLLSSYLSYAIVLASRSASSNTSSIQDLSATLCSSSTHSLLDWMPLFYSLPTNHKDSLLTRAYSALNKLCSFPVVPAKPLSRSNVVVEAGSNPLAEHIFSLRMYALRCLAYTSPGIVEGKIFWDQANRSTALFIKSIPSTTILEASASSVILRNFAELVGITETRPDKEMFMAVDDSGKSFIGFCDYWSSFAKRVGANCSNFVTIPFTLCYVGWRYKPFGENQHFNSEPIIPINHIPCESVSSYVCY